MRKTGTREIGMARRLAAVSILAVAMAIALSATGTTTPVTPGLGSIFVVDQDKHRTVRIEGKFASDQTARPSRGGLGPSIDSWKTYHNAMFGFSFQYPAVYDMLPYKARCGIRALSDEHLSLGSRSELFIFQSGRMSLDDYVRQRLLRHGEDINAPIKGRRLVAGLPAITVEYHFGGLNRYGTFTVLKRSKRFFLFIFSAGEFCNVPGSEIIEPTAYARMLDSFRFDR